MDGSRYNMTLARAAINLAVRVVVCACLVYGAYVIHTLRWEPSGRSFLDLLIDK